MNVYVIYKFKDAEQVEKLLKEYKSKDENGLLDFFRFNAGERHRMWHKKAVEKMKSCNIACYFCSAEGNEESAAKNVKWELDLANKYKKTVFIFNLKGNPSALGGKENPFAKTIFGLDYSGELLNINKYKVFDVGCACDVLMKEAQWNVEDAVVNKDFDKKGLGENEYYNLLLEEYKTMIDTSEKLMERRQNISNLYTTLCAAMAAVVGASFAFENWLIVAFIGIVVGIVFICMSANWRACLKAYEMNNAGKFAVINAIEKILPANLFDSEYRYNTKNGIKSYSNREKLLPIIFIIFGVILICLAITVIFLIACDVI